MLSGKSPLVVALSVMAACIGCGDGGVPWKTEQRCHVAPPITWVTPPRAVPGEFVNLDIRFDRDVPLPLREGPLEVSLDDRVITPTAKTFAGSRSLQLTILVPREIGPGSWLLQLHFSPNEVCADTAVPATYLTRAPTEGKVRAPNGSGFCCPPARGDCNGYRPGGWVPNENSRCFTVADARPDYREDTDEHGCRVLISTGSCL